MRFPYPLFPAEFEIPDEWLIEAGMVGFTPSSEAYHSTANATPISLCDIQPPFRSTAYPLDLRGFSRDRLISVLKGIATGAVIEPVPLLKLAPSEYCPAPYRYRVCNGFHRFYGSVMAGFESLPGVFT